MISFKFGSFSLTSISLSSGHEILFEIDVRTRAMLVSMFDKIKINSSFDLENRRRRTPDLKLRTRRPYVVLCKCEFVSFGIDFAVNTDPFIAANERTSILLL